MPARAARPVTPEPVWTDLMLRLTPWSMVEITAQMSKAVRRLLLCAVMGLMGCGSSLDELKEPRLNIAPSPESGRARYGILLLSDVGECPTLSDDVRATLDGSSLERLTSGDSDYHYSLAKNSGYDTCEHPSWRLPAEPEDGDPEIVISDATKTLRVVYAGLLAERKLSRIDDGAPWNAGTTALFAHSPASDFVNWAELIPGSADSVATVDGATITVSAPSDLIASGSSFIKVVFNATAVACEGALFCGAEQLGYNQPFEVKE